MAVKKSEDSPIYFPGRCVRAWDRFWFSPGDPSTLGLIRIFCGLTVLYIHLAYTFDLQAFFGAEAWIDAKMMNEFRHEAPILGQFKDWNEVVNLPPTPSE